jgi:Icc protein
VLIAQLTDLHCLAEGSAEPYFADNNGRAREAVARLNAEQPAPAVVLGTGDLTNDGTPGDLAVLVDVIGDLALPFLPLPGNHDEPAALKAAFPDVPWADAPHASWSVPLGAVHVIGLDSTRAGHHGGEFDPARERWLQAALDAAEAPVLLALHHPPFASGIAWMDVPFPGADRLATVIGEHAGGPNRVTKVIVGHLHRPVTTAIAGVPVQTGMSTAQHVALDLSPKSTPRLIDDPVGYQLHWWNGAEWVTHTRYIDTGTDAFVPPWADEWERSHSGNSH